jgi:hypothetical protein
MLEDNGRDPASVGITLFAWGFEPDVPSVDTLASYEQYPIERVVVGPPTMTRHDPDTTRRRLDQYRSLLTP